jgi:hypothetical protein
MTPTPAEQLRQLVQDMTVVIDLYRQGREVRLPLVLLEDWTQRLTAIAEHLDAGHEAYTHSKETQP